MDFNNISNLKQDSYNKTSQIIYRGENSGAIYGKLIIETEYEKIKIDNQIVNIPLNVSIDCFGEPQMVNIKAFPSYDFNSFVDSAPQNPR